MSILTIAIPTYNRANYLNVCLNSLNEALPNNADDVDILVIDNNSTDNTKEIVLNIQKSTNIRYINNEINIGPDENFKKCIEKANSKYVWIFGDDDIFFKNSIEYILTVIKNNNDIGLIHLRAKNFQNESEILDYKLNKFTHKNIKSKNEFIKKVHTNITFISANIFNKDYLKDEINLKDIPNNNLGQVYWNMVSIIKAEQNIFCESKIFAARQFNSGNYNFCKVFGENFIEILDLLADKYDINSLIKIINKRLLIFYYPANIIRIRNKVSRVEYSDTCFNILYKRFKFNLYFWIFSVPAILLPKKISFNLISIIEKLRSYR